ncbi:hypothetical protein ALQ93_01711 [Pseudomonas syringae pv. pisi]|nr:hypothetical protein ALQ93_01711 [Pseudomonas syringae pv. pisi]
MAQLIEGRDIYLIRDEVYEHLIFDRVRHAGVLANKALYSKAFVVSSFGKTYHATGRKTGYLIAPPALGAELRKVHQFVSFCGVTPLQWGLEDFMAACPEHIEQVAGLRLAGIVAFQFHPGGGHIFPASGLLADPPRPQ